MIFRYQYWYPHYGRADAYIELAMAAASAN